MILSHLWRTDSVWVSLVQFTYRVIRFVSTHLKLVREGLIWFLRRTGSCGSVYIQGDVVCEWFKAPPSYTLYTTVSKPETSTAPPPPTSHLCVSFTLPNIYDGNLNKMTCLNNYPVCQSLLARCGAWNKLQLKVCQVARLVGLIGWASDS